MRLGVLAAGVLVGDHQDVGQTGAHLPQHGSFALVAVAVGAEDHDEAPRGDGAHGLEGQLHGIGGVGEVDDAQAASAVTLADALHAAGDVVGTGPGAAVAVAAGTPARMAMTRARAAFWT